MTSDLTTTSSERDDKLPSWPCLTERSVSQQHDANRIAARSPAADLLAADLLATDSTVEAFPALAALRLTADDLRQLSRQGFVSRELRGQRSYFKLRFRRDGRQVVRYVGDENRAKLVKSELATLQAESRLMRQLRAQSEMANKQLRETKRLLIPVLQAQGLDFHGFAIRRKRTPTNT